MSQKNFFSYSKEIVKLAFPILGVRILYMAIGFIGMIFIAHLGEKELAAGALVTALTNTITVIAMSPLLAISIIISRYCGENKKAEIGIVVRQGWLISLIMGIIGWILFWNLPILLTYLDQPSALIPLIRGYFHGIAWGIIPSFLLASCHQMFFPIRRGKLVVYLSVLNLILTLFLGSSLIYGLYGLPKLGMEGWAYGIAIANWILLIAVLLYLFFHKEFTPFDIFNFKGKLDFEKLKLFFKISCPITMQFSSELIAFSVMNIMVGWLGVKELSVQQILLQCSMVALMIPLGVGQACTILISYAMGNNEKYLIRNICFVGMTLVIFSMMIIAGVYWIVPEKIISLYIPLNDSNQAIIHLATIMLALVAFNQLADAVRNLVIASLRGLQDIWHPMWINMVLLWIVALPCSYLLAFPLGKGLLGVNLGFLIAFILGAILMTMRFIQKTKINKF